MIAIDNVLVSTQLVEEYFVCRLDACKGACCVAGDCGAPLEPRETAILERIYPDVRPFLTTEGRTAIEQQGTWVRSEHTAYPYETPLIDGGPCAYITYDTAGVAQCGIEVAYRHGATEFRKPISCHLYPVRVKPLGDGLEALNYDEWEICSTACSNGTALGVRVYEFVREALERKYGPEFYAQLHAAAAYALRRPAKD